MPIDNVNFDAMLARAAVLGGAVNALDDSSYSGVMATVNGNAKDRWHFPAPPAAHKKLASDVIELLSDPRLSLRQRQGLQRAFRGT